MKNNFQHRTPVQIRFNDIDIMAHVNNSVYQNFFDLARKTYFEEVFEEKVNWKDQALVLAKITIEYFKPILLDEKVEVHTRVHTLGNKSLQMIQKIVCTQTQEVKAINDAVLVFYDVNKNESAPLSEKWRNKIIAFEKEVVLS